MMAALVYDGKPVAYIDEYDCDLRISEHCTDGVIETIGRLNPKLTRNQNEGISYRIHIAMKAYLLECLVIALRRDQKKLVQSIADTRTSPCADCL
jgi:hypothetical protein